MKKFLVASFCLLILTSCSSSPAANHQNRKIAEAVYQEGKAYFSQERYSIALGKFIEAEKIIKDDRFLQYDLGYTYFLKKKYNLSELHFKKALEIEPDFTPALNALGVVFLEQKQWDKSIISFNKCLDSLIYPTPHYALANLGWAYFGKRNYTLANQNFLKALEKSPNYSQALHGFATVSLEINQGSIALGRLERALRKAPKSWIIHYDLAKIYDKSGQFHKAKQYWEKVIELAPEGSKFLSEAEKRLM